MISVKGWVWLGIITTSILIWYCIFTIGFWHVLLWMSIGAMLGVIIIKIKERKNDNTRHIG